MVTDPSLPAKGPVADVLFEELRAQSSSGGPAGEVVSSVKTKYDEQGRAVEEVRRDYGVETNTISRYEGNRLVSQETTFPNSKTPRPKFWNYWIYDQDGKLTEYRRGSGDSIQNHDTNFKRDEQGRLTSFEYRQGAKDELFSRTELRYSADGKTIDITSYDQSGGVTDSSTETVDAQGRVIQVVTRERDWKTKALKPPLKVVFTYGKKGRLLEQNTDEHTFEAAGSEQELPPGKVTISYDDLKHTRRTAYTSKEGSLASTVTFDSSGAVIGMAMDAGEESFEAKLECKYDSRENWVSCQQIVKKADLNMVGKVWRRAITYR